MLFHEILRVFHDRLVNVEDRKMMLNIMLEKISYLGYKEDHESIMSLKYTQLNKLKYEKVRNEPELISHLSERIKTQFVKQHKSNVVLFADFIETLLKVSRVLG